MLSKAQKKKGLVVGLSDFKERFRQNCYFVDKSLLIKEILDFKAAVTLVTRPRRFGKTLNLSMLRFFFEKTEENNRHLFSGLKIEKYSDCMAHQGQYPVIWLTLKDCKDSSWAFCYRHLQEIVTSEFARHNYLLDSNALNTTQRNNFAAILDKSADEILYRRALLILSECLSKHHNKHAIILIDEYDTPIHSSFNHKYYEQAIEFFRDFFGAGLKDNSCLDFGFLTGILRIAKESIFSDINNLRICPLTDDKYADKFGLLEEEVETILHYFNLENSIDTVRKWYDGYHCGSQKIYNPWSVVNVIEHNGAIKPYWINTSENTLIKELLRASSTRTKEDLEVIIKGGKVTKPIQENIVMADLKNNDNVLWNFLLFCGYLTFENRRLEGRSQIAELSAPNEEVIEVYEASFKSWFETPLNISAYTTMLESLIVGDVESFREFFTKLTLETLSSFDIIGNEPELFYHALVLGMLTSLSQTHEVKSNRESGYGRYDVMLIPHDKTKLGIIIEFKKVHVERNETLESEAHKALNQLEDRKYETELRTQGFKKILKLGISFKGKDCLVLTREN